MSYALASFGDASDFVPWEILPDAWQPDDVAAASSGASAASSGAGPAACAAAGGTWNGTVCSGAETESVDESGTGSRITSGGGGGAPVGGSGSAAASKTARSVLPWVLGAAALGTLLWLFTRTP